MFYAMRPRIGQHLLLSLGLAGVALIPGSRALSQAPPGVAEIVSLTVRDYSGVDRTNEPVTTGIPIAPDRTGAAWALFDGAQEIPVQTTILPNRTVPWLLLDFQTSLGAGVTRTLTLKEQGPTASPSSPVTITEDAQRITVTTGSLRTEISRTEFNLLDQVWFDRDGDGQFRATEQIVYPTSGSNVAAHDAGGDLDYPGRGQPHRIEWEYRGPLRATLRVDGAYARGADTLLDYTTRLTWWAGQTSLRIEHVLRNSLAARERYVKLSSARLAIGAATATSRVQRSGSIVWSNVTPAGAALELIPPTLSVSTEYAPYATPALGRLNATVDVDVNGGMVIGDLSHHGAIWQVDFASLSPSERTRLATVAVDPLVALAEPGRYAELGAFGQLHFGTYADEKNAYRRWGWTWPTLGNAWSEEHNRPRVQEIFPSWSVLDATNDPESDDLWENIVMFARVQIPFYLDRQRAWARYAKWEWAFRTDGFDYAGAWGYFTDGPGTVSRTPILRPPLTALDTAYIAHNIKYGKAGVSHMWNGGLLDDYYLTGNRDALEAAIDVAEQCERYLGWRNLWVGGNSRFQARCLLVQTRTWEATNDHRWKEAADHVAGLFLGSANYDPRGFFFNRIGDMGPSFTSRFSSDAKQVTPFMMTAVVQALYRYYLVTDDAAVRAQLLQIAAFGRDHGLDPATGYGGDEIVVDSPRPGDVLHLTQSQWRDVAPIVPYTVASSSECFVNAMVIGYRLTGDRSYLDRAKLCWNQASKRDYTAPYDQRLATDSQVGRFENSLQAWPPTSLRFPTGGDLTSTSFLFYEAAHLDAIPPERVLDLRPK